MNFIKTKVKLSKHFSLYKESSDYLLSVDVFLINVRLFPLQLSESLNRRREDLNTGVIFLVSVLFEALKQETNKNHIITFNKNNYYYYY